MKSYSLLSITAYGLIINFFITNAFISLRVAGNRHEVPTLSARGLPESSCQLSTNGSYLNMAFKTQWDNFTVVGEAQNGFFGGSLTFNVDFGGKLFMSYNGTLDDGVHTLALEYGDILNSACNFTFVTTASNGTSPSFNNSVGLNLSRTAPHVPEQLASYLHNLSKVVEAEVRGCKGLALDESFQSRDFAIMGREVQYGVQPVIDDTTHNSRCTICLAEASAAAVACGLGCGFSFGLACVCAAGIPLLYANCHNPGTGIGQGCCPVSCGAATQIVGIDTVSSCCFSGESCLNPDAGLCCGAGLQTCGGTECCPSTAPCRDVGICCPVDHNTCTTANGPECCYAGEVCDNEMCCAAGTTGCGGTECCNADESCIAFGAFAGCCPKASRCGDACCPAGSTCVGDSYCCSPEYMCGNVCCEPQLAGDLFGSVCLDASINLCCFEGQHQADDMCCDAGEFSCYGECCAGSCEGEGVCSRSNACLRSNGLGPTCNYDGDCIQGACSQSGCCVA